MVVFPACVHLISHWQENATQSPNNKHIMTGPRETVCFVSLWPPVFPEAKLRETVKRRQFVTLHSLTTFVHDCSTKSTSSLFMKSLYVVHCTVISVISHFSHSVCYRGSTMTNVKVLCWRDQVRSGKRETSHSLVLNIKLPSFPTKGN